MLPEDVLLAVLLVVISLDGSMFGSVELSDEEDELLVELLDLPEEVVLVVVLLSFTVFFAESLCFANKKYPPIASRITMIKIITAMAISRVFFGFLISIAQP